MEVSKINEEKGIIADEVESYILGTLLYTPQAYIANPHFKYCEIKAYGPGQQQPSMKIFRMYFHCTPLDGYPPDLLEVAFQDEVSIVKGCGIDSNERWQVNFSIDVDRKTFLYRTIRERPKKLLHLKESMDVFSSLSKQKGSIMFAGGWQFESDGNGWVAKSQNSRTIESVMPQLTATSTE